MSNDTAAQAEATGEALTFDYFDRTWHLPASVRLSHQRALQRNPSNVGIVDAFLSADDVEVLNKIDPTAEELDAFTDVMLERLGLKNAGN
jgi:hypothetical protein